MRCILDIHVFAGLRDLMTNFVLYLVVVGPNLQFLLDYFFPVHDEGNTAIFHVWGWELVDEEVFRVADVVHCFNNLFVLLRVSYVRLRLAVLQDLEKFTSDSLARVAVQFPNTCDSLMITAETPVGRLLELVSGSFLFLVVFSMTIKEILMYFWRGRFQKEGV